MAEAELIGIAFPVHGFNPPWIVEETFRKLELPQHKRYFILKTAGDPFINGGMTTFLQNLLRKKLWKLQYEALVPMPANLFIRYTDSFIKLNAQMAVKQAESIATDLMEGRSRVLPNQLDGISTDRSVQNGSLGRKLRRTLLESDLEVHQMWQVHCQLPHPEHKF